MSDPKTVKERRNLFAAKEREPKSLSIVTPFYPPSLGGIERYSQGLARAAAASGLAVRVVTTAGVRIPEISVEEGGIRVLRLPALTIPMQGSYYPIPLRGLREVSDFLRCDIVLAQTRFFLTTALAAVVSACQKRRICIVEHGAGPLRADPFFSIASMAYERLTTSTLRLLRPRFFAVSASAARWLNQFGVYDAQVLPNAVPPSAVTPDRSKKASDTTTVFYAGRLLAEKGISELVDAVELLARGGTDVILKVAGSGPLSEVLQQRSKSSRALTYLGAIPAERVALELRSADVLVNPSKLAEGCPTILLEAGNAALPVISTPFGGSGEIIAEGRTGWIVPRADAALIAAALRKVITQPAEARRRGVELFREVQDSYTWPVIVARLLAYLREDARSVC